jgi:hypothetical protein
VEAVMLAYEHYIYAAVVVLGTALAVLTISFILRREKLRAKLEPLAGMSASLVTVLGLLFGLTMVFIANDTWNARMRANDAVVREADGLRALIVMANEQAPIVGYSVGDAARSYAGALITEWPRLRVRESDPEVIRSGDRLLDIVASAQIAKVAGQSLQSLMLNKVMEVRASHALRVELAKAHINPLKWVGMAFLGLVTMIALAGLHADKPKSGIAAIIFFSLAAAPEAAIVLVQGNPFQPPLVISALPLAQILQF